MTDQKRGECDPSDGPGEGVLTRWEPPSEKWPKGRVVDAGERHRLERAVIDASKAHASITVPDFVAIAKAQADLSDAVSALLAFEAAQGEKKPPHPFLDDGRLTAMVAGRVGE